METQETPSPPKTLELNTTQIQEARVLEKLGENEIEPGQGYGVEPGIVTEKEKESSNFEAKTGIVRSPVGEELMGNGGFGVSGDGSGKKVENLEGRSEAKELVLKKVPTWVSGVGEFNNVARQSGELGNVEGECEEDGWGFEDYKDYEFAVGDFVWCKLSNRPWWPGQVYDPSDASKEVARFHRRDRVLVAFFGTGMSVAWCYPLQIRPFEKNFGRMLKQGSFTGDEFLSFHSAVEMACAGIRRQVELVMACECVPMETRIRLAGLLTVNSGIKEGVLVPKGVMDGISVAEYEPEKFLAHLRHVAQVIPEPGVFELTVFQSQLLAFYRVRGDKRFLIGHELEGAVDCEDNGGNSIISKIDSDVQAGDISLRPPEEGWPSSPVSSEFGQITLQQKMHSVTDLSLSASRKSEKGKDLKSRLHGGLAEDGSTSKNSASSPKKQKGRKHSGCLSTITEKRDVSAVSDAIEANGGTKTGTFSRERKKSKYLSPPYTTLSKGNKSLAYLEFETESQVPKAIFRKEPSKESQMRKQKRIALKLANVAADELLSEFYASALDAFYLKESQMYGVVKGFFLQFRIDRSMNNEMFGDNLAGRLDRKRTCLDSRPGSLGDEMHVPNVPVLEGATEGKRRKRKKEPMFVSPESKNANATEGNASNNVDDNKKDPPATIPLKYAQKVEMHATKIPISESVVEGNKRKRKKEATVVIPESRPCNAADGKGGQSVEGNREASVTVPLKYAVGLEMHVPKQPVADGVPEGNGRKRKKEAIVGSPLNTAALATDGLASHSVKVNGETSSETVLLKVATSGVTEGKKEALFVSPNTIPATAMPSHNVEANKGSSPLTISLSALQETTNGTNHIISEGEGKASYDVEANRATSSAALLLKFAPGVPLPTKDGLVAVLGRFGALNEMDTKILRDSGYAQVVYIRSSDAEEAFNSLQKNSPFGPATGSYLIQHGSATCKESRNDMQPCLSPSSVGGSKLPAKPSKNSKSKLKLAVCLPLASRGGNLPTADSMNSKPQDLPTTKGDKTPLGESSAIPSNKVADPALQLSLPPPSLTGDAQPLQLIRQNLEMMTSMLEKSGNNLSPEVKANLETEVRRLHSKVTSMVESPPDSSSH